MNNKALTVSLSANAAFSGVTGIVSAALAGRLAESLGPPAWAIRALGVGLVIFAAIVARESRAPSRARTWQIIAADIAWVAIAVGIMATTPSWLTGVGNSVLGAVTVAVAVLATAQWRGLEAAA